MFTFLFSKKLVVTDSVLAKIHKYSGRGIKHIEINTSHGWTSGNDLGFLEEFKDSLVRLDIIDGNSADYSIVETLVNLEDLHIGSYTQSTLNLSNLRTLKKLAIYWHNNLDGLDKLTELEELFLYKFNSEDFSILSNLNTLHTFVAKNCYVKNVSGLPKSLQSIQLALCSKMKDFHDLTHLTNLSTLTLDTCKHLDKLTFVDSLKNLKTLDVSNCGVIESLHPVMKLPYLERLSFIESTDIEDGNIAQLKDHPSLQWVLFQDRKHYDAKRNEFEWKINTDSKHYE